MQLNFVTKTTSKISRTVRVVAVNDVMDMVWDAAVSEVVARSSKEKELEKDSVFFFFYLNNDLPT